LFVVHAYFDFALAEVFAGEIVGLERTVNDVHALELFLDFIHCRGLVKVDFEFNDFLGGFLVALVVGELVGVLESTTVLDLPAHFVFRHVLHVESLLGILLLLVLSFVAFIFVVRHVCNAGVHLVVVQHVVVLHVRTQVLLPEYLGVDLVLLGVEVTLVFSVVFLLLFLLVDFVEVAFLIVVHVENVALHVVSLVFVVWIVHFAPVVAVLWVH